MKTIDQYRYDIEEAIEYIPLAREPHTLYDAFRYAMTGGGKRLRPILTLAMCDALGGDTTDAMTPALAVEIFHNFTLVHDDIMDGSPTRHGRESVWKKYGIPTAILAGDVMAAMPVTMLALSHNPEKARRYLGEYQGLTAKVLDGQQIDIDMERSEGATIEDYIEMITCKTGALLHLACSLGALAAGRDMRALQAAGGYGRNLGIAFQLQDDLLDTYGDEAVLGKPVGGDIANRKNTILRLRAIELCPEEVKRIETAGLSDAEMFNAMRELYDRLNLPETIESLIDEFTSEAIDSLKPLKLREANKQFFIDLASKLTTRNR